MPGNVPRSQAGVEECLFYMMIAGVSTLALMLL
jgi:hypothetical protein